MTITRGNIKQQITKPPKKKKRKKAGKNRQELSK